jgi:hypothetical protein
MKNGNLSKRDSKKDEISQDVMVLLMGSTSKFVPLQIMEAIISTTRVLIALFLWQLLMIIIALDIFMWGIMEDF